MQQLPISLLTLTAGILITLISLWVGQNHHLLPVQASAQAPLVDGFFNVMVTIGVALFLVVEGAILLFAIMFRRRPGDNTDGEPIEGNFSLEIFWTAIPALIVIGLGIYSVEVYQQMGGFAPATAMMAHVGHPASHPNRADSAIAAPLTPSTDGTMQVADAQDAPTYGIGATPAEQGKAADLTVNVLGLQYAWVFTYPDQGITAGELHVPLGQDVQLNISAQDVIHSFWVPQFRLKQDALPGNKTELRFVATRLGTYPVVCAELCGSYHGGMRTQVIVHTPEEYDQWVASQVAAAPETPALEAIATRPADLAPTDFLTPYARDLGVTSTALAQLHAHSGT